MATKVPEAKRVEVSLGAGEIEELTERLLSRLGEDLEDRLAELVRERVEEALGQSVLWVPRQLRTKDVAYLLRVPDTKARQMVSTGDIPRLNLSADEEGKTYRVDPRDLNLWLDAHQDFPARREELRLILEEGKALIDTR